MARILVVDDEAMLRSTFRSILEKAGHTVVEAGDGDECLKAFRQQRPDLILIDIVMPKREGVETVGELRRLDPHIPIIAMSGGGSAGTTLFLDLAVNLGATEALHKPIRREALLAAVDKHLGEA